MPSLSKRMIEALERAGAAGKLYRWAGGYWSDREPTSDTAFPPAGVWFVTAVTVNALLDRGLLIATETHPVGKRSPRVVAPAESKS